MTGLLNLTIPPLNTSGPGYASIINTDLQTIITHNHDGVNNGVLINLNAQIVSGDLSLDGYNLSNVRSVQFISQPSQLSGSQDVNSIYVNQNNLGFNNSNGIFVPITSGNTLAITALPFTNLTIRSVSSNFTILPTDTYNTINVNTGSGAITGTLPIAATITPLAAGRLFLFRDVGGLASAHPITIQVSVGSGNQFYDSHSTTFVINNDGGYAAFYTDGISQWYSWDQNVYNDESVIFNQSLVTFNNNTIATFTTDGRLNLDNTSAIFVNGGGLIVDGSGAIVVEQSSTVSINDSALTWSNTATETHATGTTETFQVGSSLVLDGSLSGTTTGGTLAVAGIINLTGTENVSGTLTIPGTLDLNGTGITASAGATLAGVLAEQSLTINQASVITNSDKASTVDMKGTSNLYGVAYTQTTISAGTYNVDSSSDHYDYFIGLLLENTGIWTINLPANPVPGRMLVIMDANYLDITTPPTYTVNIVGNGHNIANWYQTTGGSLGTQTLTVSSVTSAGWGLNLMYVATVGGGVWEVPGFWNL